MLLPTIHQAASTNELFIIPPGEVHTARSLGEDGWSYHMMYLEPNLLQQAVVEITERNKPLYLRPFMIAGQQIRTPFQQLYQSIRESGTELEQQSQLLIAIAQLIVQCSEDPPPLPRLRQERKAVRQVRDYLHDNYSTIVSLDQLSELTHLSKFHLVRVFTKEVGLSPHAYQTQLRVERARQLLAKGWSPAQVARETGFAHVSHLHRHFRRSLGFTPAWYAKTARTCKD